MNNVANHPRLKQGLPSEETIGGNIWGRAWDIWIILVKWWNAK
jgi:hypothetical protein